MLFGFLFNKDGYLNSKIDIYSKKIKNLSTEYDSTIIFKRGLLYLEIQEPDLALADFIIASKLDKSLIKKCKLLCGKYHPILLEKYISALYYQIDTSVIKPFKK